MQMVSALGRYAVSHYLLVRLTESSGLQGIGEATVAARWSGETVAGAKTVLEDVFAPQILDVEWSNPAELDARLDRVCVGNWFAKAALEMAAWDLLGKAEGQPVYELLGGPVRPAEIRCRFSLGAYPPERAAQRARELVQAGFTTLKVKVGTNPLEDIARVLAVRDAVPATIDLMIDANGGWDVETALRCLDELRSCRLVLMEQPTPPGDYAALARVRAEGGVPVMADESCFDLVHARELIRQGCCDVLSLYPGKNGGLSKARRIAEFAAQHEIPCTIGSNLELDIGTAAMAHLIRACPNLQVERYPGDLLGPSYHAQPLVRNPLDIRGPLTTLGSGPGLGIDVDWDAVSHALF